MEIISLFSILGSRYDQFLPEVRLYYHIYANKCINMLQLNRLLKILLITYINKPDRDLN